MSAVSSSRPVLAIAGDPGGAMALAPVIEALSNDSSNSLIVCAYRQAFDIWRERGLSPLQQEAWQPRLPELIGEASLLLTGTSVNGIDLERTAIALARECGVPSLAVLDYWSNYRLRFNELDGVLILPDKIAVMDEFARDEMVVAGFPVENLIVTGQPAFDTLADARKAYTSERRQALRAEIGVGREDKLILYISQPFAKIYGSDVAAQEVIGYNEKIVFLLCQSALEQLATKHRVGFTMAIRPHPRESVGDFPENRRNSFRTVLWSGVDRLEAVMAADIVLGMNSALLFEASCIQCVVVSVQPGLKIPDPLPSNRTGASVAVTNAAELVSVLEKTLFDESWHHQHELVLKDIKITSCATERVIFNIMNLQTN